MSEQNFQGLSVTLEHGEHKEGQHDDNHERCCHADTDRLLGQKKQRHAYQRAQAETDDLPFCQVKKELGFDPGQILGNRYVCDSASLLFHQLKNARNCF